MIVSNGAAPAALALDELWLRNGKLATLSEETRDALRRRCRLAWRSPTRWIYAMTPVANTISGR